MYDRQGFVNKVGSGAWVRAAEVLGKPVLVLAEKFMEVPRIPELPPWQPHVRLVSD